MATGTQVPWTTPGGTPCCCNICTNTEIEAAYGTVPAHFASVILSEATFSAIRLGGLYVRVTFDLASSEGGSFFLGGANMIQFLQYTGCRFRFEPDDSSDGGFLLWQLTSGGWIYELDFFCSFNIFIQDGGTGWPSSPSSPSTDEPVLFLSGLNETGSNFFRIGQVRGIGQVGAPPPPSNLAGFLAAFGNQHSGSGTATLTTNIFGASVTTTATSNVDALISVTVSLPPP